MEKLKKDMMKSGYQENELQKIEEKMNNRNNEEEPTTEETGTITFPVFYFDGINELKKIIHNSKTELHQLIGNTKIVMAVKKNPSIGNSCVRNKILSTE